MARHRASNAGEVKNLCSRRLLDMLRNREWGGPVEKTAIEEELLQRRHYLPQLRELSCREPTGPFTATGH